LGGEQPDWNAGRQIDVLLGADIIYDKKVVPSLVSTIADLIEMFPDIIVVIAATIRNEGTFNSFLQSCQSNGFLAEMIHFSVVTSQLQRGPFYSDKTAIKLCTIRRSSAVVANLAP